MQQFFASLSTWWHKPFSPEMSALQIVLLTGLVMVAIIFWLIVLGHLRNVTA